MAQARQLLGIALASKNSAVDAQACHTGNVRDNVMELDIHLRQRQAKQVFDPPMDRGIPVQRSMRGWRRYNRLSDPVRDRPGAVHGAKLNIRNGFPFRPMRSLKQRSPPSDGRELDRQRET